jgi:hypothetical protein
MNLKKLDKPRRKGKQEKKHVMVRKYLVCEPGTIVPMGLFIQYAGEKMEPVWK